MGFLQQLAVYIAIIIGIVIFFRLPKRLGFINRILLSLLFMLVIIIGVLFISFIIGFILIIILILLLLYLFNRRKFKF